MLSYSCDSLTFSNLAGADPSYSCDSLTFSNLAGADPADVELHL